MLLYSLNWEHSVSFISVIFTWCTCSQTQSHTCTHARSVRQVQSYMHNEAGQVSKGTALCTRVKWGLHIWQKNRSVHAAARLTLVYTVTQISKLNGDQRGQWSSCTAAWMRSWQTPPPLPLFRWCLLLHSDAHVGYRVSHLSNAWLENTASTLSLSNYHELLWSAFTFCETDIQECCLWACADAQLICFF